MIAKLGSDLPNLPRQKPPQGWIGRKRTPPHCTTPRVIREEHALQNPVNPFNGGILKCHQSWRVRYQGSRSAFLRCDNDQPNAWQTCRVAAPLSCEFETSGAYRKDWPADSRRQFPRTDMRGPFLRVIFAEAPHQRGPRVGTRFGCGIGGAELRDWPVWATDWPCPPGTDCPRRV
jgi:hypothetical protein